MTSPATPPISPEDRSITAFIGLMSQPARYPAGVAAGALTAAMGLALFEKALAHPAEGQDWKAGNERQVLAALRKRVQELAAKDARPLEALERAEALPAGPDRAQAVAGARLMAYRSARRLLDYTVQGLTLLQSALDFGSTAFLTDIEAGHRLLVAAQETAIAASEDHLREMDPTFAGGEGAALANQARQGRELQARAEGALSWRRGKV